MTHKVYNQGDNKKTSVGNKDFTVQAENALVDFLLASKMHPDKELKDILPEFVSKLTALHQEALDKATKEAYELLRWKY